MSHALKAGGHLPAWPVRVATLVRRERKTRFAGGAFGLLWAYVIPASWVAFVVMIFNLTGRVPPIHAGAEIFVATGILPYIMFRQTLTTMTRSAISNRNLRVIRGVRPADLLTASALFELMNMFVMMVVIFGAVILIFGAEPPANPAKVVLGMGGAWMLGVGLGRLIAILGLMSDAVSRAVPILLRPTFWISGIFYTANELTGTVRDILWWSPLFHATEILREGYFLGFSSPISDPRMVLVAALIPYVLSFPAEILLLRRGLSRYRL
ncbi:ABC transporter permease [Rhodovulum tesquicola]|uniref:Capsular polysaccharide transport system permease protein n=1 Tax=Rhodovulum steppense TaxID=540251 RepID=A0A4R1YWH1_9RHOB|nr:ABC transporter permease [Rhodovulum steppense]MCO8146831.1 ABC transporter permease [Rhodovulum tesquicola]TCM85522.1 capsular polysaccharide transport system permease protein [Rhodovulum steppense]